MGIGEVKTAQETPPLTKAAVTLHQQLDRLDGAREALTFLLDGTPPQEKPTGQDLGPHEGSIEGHIDHAVMLTIRATGRVDQMVVSLEALYKRLNEVMRSLN